ncbi:MAG: hypothetical protein K0U40_10105 [Betaproteobacteria bacterium]|nr:hypothetical protein [Betaproteobacteria bacterium]
MYLNEETDETEKVKVSKLTKAISTRYAVFPTVTLGMVNTLSAKIATFLVSVFEVNSAVTTLNIKVPASIKLISILYKVSPT